MHVNISWSTLLRLALMDFDQTELELYISSKTTYLWPYKLWKRWIDNIDNKDMVSLYSRVLRKWKVIIVYILKMPGIFLGPFSSKIKWWPASLLTGSPNGSVTGTCYNIVIQKLPQMSCKWTSGRPSGRTWKMSIAINKDILTDLWETGW